MRLCGCGFAPHMLSTQLILPSLTTQITSVYLFRHRTGIFDCFTSTFPCRWAFVLLLGHAYRLVQCRQLLLNTNQLPSCQEHPVSPELGQRAGIEPAFMDRWDSIPTRSSPYLVHFARLWILLTYPLRLTFRHYPRPFFVCKGCAGLINIWHSPVCSAAHRLSMLIQTLDFGIWIVRPFPAITSWNLVFIYRRTALTVLDCDISPASCNHTVVSSMKVAI